MQKKTINTILISGNKIGVTVALKDCGNVFSLLANVSNPHDGIYDGEFLNEANFSFSLSSCLSKAESVAKQSITEAYVGVPVEFCSFETATHDVNLGTRKKVTTEILNNIYETATQSQKKPNFSLLSCSTISCKLDDAEEVVSPVGFKAKNLKITLSYAFVNNSFLNFLNKCFKNYGLATAIFVPMAVCEYVSLFEDASRAKGAFFINCNTLSTNIVFGKGDGVVKSFSFPVGVAHIVADIQEVFKVSFTEGEYLVYSTVMTSVPSEKEVVVLGENTIYTKMVWETVNYHVNQMLKQVCSTIEMLEENSIPVEKIFITGDGITRILNVKFIFEKKTGKKVALLVPKTQRFAKPQFASQYSLLKYSSKECSK